MNAQFPIVALFGFFHAKVLVVLREEGMVYLSNDRFLENLKIIQEFLCELFRDTFLLSLRIIYLTKRIDLIFSGFRPVLTCLNIKLFSYKLSNPTYIFLIFAPSTALKLPDRKVLTLTQCISIKRFRTIP